MWEIFAKSLRKILKNLLARFLSRRHVNYMQDFGQKISLADEIIPQLASGSVSREIQKFEAWILYNASDCYLLPFCHK